MLYRNGRRLVGDHTVKSKLETVHVTESQFADDLFSNATFAAVQYLLRLTVVSLWLSLYWSTPVLYEHHIHKEISSIESVQRCAERFAFNDYTFNPSVTEMLQRLNWPSLSSCRDQLKTVTMFKMRPNFGKSPLFYTINN